MAQHYLFEYGTAQHYQGDVEQLQQYLNKYWQQLQKERGKRPAQGAEQPFLDIEGQHIRARNYLGVLQIGQQSIYLLPKLLEQQSPLLPKSLSAVQAHWWWWLRYSRLLLFPKVAGRQQALLDQPLEYSIHLFAQACQERLFPLRLQGYQQKTANLKRLRGKLELAPHLRQNVARGQWQHLYCSYEELQLDIRPYQLLKYCFRLLLQHSKEQSNQKKLADLILKLKNIPDNPTEDKAWPYLKLSPLFADLQGLLDSANQFLKQLLPAVGGEGAPAWSLLFPAEQLFEAFLSGFVQKNLPAGWRVVLQEQAHYLSTERRFALRPDFVFYGPKSQVQIADIKYKRLRPEQWESDIQSADLYQLLTYGLRYGSSQLHLFYPSSRPWTKRFSVAGPLQSQPFEVQVHGLVAHQSDTQLEAWSPQQTVEEQFAPLASALRRQLQEILT